MEGVPFEDVRSVLRTMNESVALEIQKTFDFFKATTAQDRIDRIVLCGGASQVDGFAELLEERFGAPVEGLDPFKTVALDAEAGIVEPDMAPTAAVAVGLALGRRGTDDSHQPAGDRTQRRQGRVTAIEVGQKMMLSSLVLVRPSSASAGGSGRSARSRRSSRATSSAAAREARLRTSSRRSGLREPPKQQLEARVTLIDELRGPDRAGPHDRRVEQGDARDAVAHRAKQDAATRSRSRAAARR